MKKNSILLSVLQIILLSGVPASVAQFPLKLPKLKIEKPKTEGPSPAGQPAARSDSRATAAESNEQPTIAKDSVQARAFTLSSYRNNNAVWSWVPKIEYRVNGPIASGSQLYVEFSMPSRGSWVKLDCKTEPTGAGYSHKTECGGREIAEDKGTTYTGPVRFSIGMRNELAGGDIPLFTGTMKVAKVRSNETAPNTVDHFVYYVDHDWNLPIGYVFYEPDEQWELDRPERWAKPKFSIAFWTRGETQGFAEPHLFFKGKEVGKLYNDGREVGTPNCSTPEAENNVTHITTPNAPSFKWTRWKCTFYNVLPWNRRDKSETMFGRLRLFSENPGEYEVKIMLKGRLIRSFRFSVDREGRLIDNSIAAANKLGSDRLIVPVQVVGDLDGPWNRTAWKTDAFYGNPLTGFAVP
ncbi:MAG: hypothetical protein AB7F88_12945 [Pyrinomonadaceae bacterium]